jgi:enediyne biosynthesis protein E4
VHFGLGAETSAATVEIRWPHGALQTLKNVACDRILKIEEPH